MSNPQEPVCEKCGATGLKAAIHKVRGHCHAPNGVHGNYTTMPAPLPNVTSVTYEDDYSGLKLVKQFPRMLFGEHNGGIEEHDCPLHGGNAEGTAPDGFRYDTAHKETTKVRALKFHRAEGTAPECSGLDCAAGKTCPKCDADEIARSSEPEEGTAPDTTSIFDPKWLQVDPRIPRDCIGIKQADGSLQLYSLKTECFLPAGILPPRPEEGTAPGLLTDGEGWRQQPDSLHTERWRLDVPPLEGHDGCAHYTVQLGKFDGRWGCTWWHGNQGHKVGGKPDEWLYFSTKEEAQANCMKHLSALVEALCAQAKLANRLLKEKP